MMKPELNRRKNYRVTLAFLVAIVFLGQSSCSASSDSEKRTEENLYMTEAEMAQAGEDSVTLRHVKYVSFKEFKSVLRECPRISIDVGTSFLGDEITGDDIPSDMYDGVDLIVGIVRELFPRGDRPPHKALKCIEDKLGAKLNACYLCPYDDISTLSEYYANMYAYNNMISLGPYMILYDEMHITEGLSNLSQKPSGVR